MNAKIVVWLLTLFLVSFFVLMASSISDSWKNALIMITPVIMVTGVIIVLRDRAFTYPELKDDEDFGYLDRPDLNP